MEKIAFSPDDHFRRGSFWLLAAQVHPRAGISANDDPTMTIDANLCEPYDPLKFQDSGISPADGLWNAPQDSTHRSWMTGQLA